MQTQTQTQPLVSRSTPSLPRSHRLMSVDALRGFDMFWIIGADSLVYALSRMTQTRPTSFLGEQLEHAEWQGFRFYDLIFPLFIFLVGVSLVFSLQRTLEEEGLAPALKRVFRRSILLFLMGLLYYGGAANAWPGIRITGVLNRIALAYFFAGLLFCFFRPRALAGIFLAILLGYWGLMALVPIHDIQLTKPALEARAQAVGEPATAELFRQPGNPSAQKDSPAWAAAEKMFYGTTDRVTGKFDKGYNLSDHFDFRYLPGAKYDHFFDPEGILSTIPAVATCLLGVFAGLLLRNTGVPDGRKLALLCTFGAAGVIGGWLWNLEFPVIKKIWTSSYVLVAGGYSALLLALFYWLVEVRNYRSWCQPFVWMGMNAITVYVVSRVIKGFDELALFFAGGDVRAFLDTRVTKGFGDLVVALVGLLLAFAFVRFLYQRKIFLRF